MPKRTYIDDLTIYELRQKLEQLTNAFDLLDVHIIITDRNGIIIYANKAAQVITGFNLNEMIGKNPADLWGGHEKGAFYNKMWKTIKLDKKPFVGRVRNKKKDGTLIFQELHLTPILDDQGEAEYFVSIELDVTAEEMEKQLLDSKDLQIKELTKLLIESEQKVSDLLPKHLSLEPKKPT